MTPDRLVLAACAALTTTSAFALLLLRIPTSALSRLVDRPVAENTTREGAR